MSMVFILSFQNIKIVNVDTISNTESSDKEQSILNDIPNKEMEYKEYGLNAPVLGDLKTMERTSVGSWSWRDGLICVTDQGFGVGPFNTWHAGIIAPQKNYSVAEVANSNSPVRLRKGKWTQGTVWQVGVKTTTIQQDWNAGHWAGEQVGKPYNLNFWNARQTNSFYCSQLVWAAYYYTSGIDLNKSDNDIGSAIAIHPGEFVKNSKTTIVYRNR